MADILRMKTPAATPDSLRQLLQLSKKFYDLHTRRYLGFEDIDGLQYVGTSENFGSELLFESRKLRMNRPPEKFIKPCALLTYFFQISHSDFIEAYPQQNLLMACVKKDVLLSTHSYSLRFDNASFKYFVRSEAYSDQESHASIFYVTTTNPTLIIDDVEYPLYVGQQDNSDEHVTWYFAFNQTTKNKCEITDLTTITLDLKDFIELPVIWLCTADMRTLPTMHWFEGTEPGNLDWQDRSLIEFGVNGNDTIFLYPWLYGDDNYPIPQIPGFNPDTGYWYAKVYGDFMIDRPDYNMTAKVTRIGYVHCQTESFTAEPDFEYYFTYDDKYTKLSLTNFGYPANLSWAFRIPVEGDYDYDSSGAPNVMSACIWLQPFKEANVIHSMSPANVFLPLLKVSFNDKYFHPYESEVNAMTTGIHIDMTTDYSDHSVDKRFGVIHNLGEFDGLPEYYKYYLDRKIHHAHVEMYAIRDDANVRNQHAMDKQTAAILLDSAVPVNDYGEITADMKPVIVYKGPGTYNYITKEENIVSKLNMLTDIGLIDRNHFGDVNIPGLPYTHKFVYHGNRHFSLGVINVDPDMEYGRGYLLTNDSIEYVNNRESKNPKAPRTAARICDIPTSYAQLQHIEGTAPTLIIDGNYVRSQASFTEQKYLSLWNNVRWFTPYPYWFQRNPSRIWISSAPELNQFFSDPYWLIRNTGLVETPRRTISITDCEFRITESGEDYQNGDWFGFNIGGVFLKGWVTAVYGDGGIMPTGFILNVNSTVPGQEDMIYQDIQITLANLDGRVSYLPVETITGVGHGAEISITVPQTLPNPDDPENPIPVWDARLTGVRTQLNPDAFALIEDNLGRGVSFVTYNATDERWDVESAVQVTGDLSPGNPVYDDPQTVRYRSLLDVYLYNLLYNPHTTRNNILEDAVNEKSILVSSKHGTFSAPDMTIETLVTPEPETNKPKDISKIVSDAGLNKWNSFIAAVPTTDRSAYYTIAWSYDQNASTKDFLFPKFSGVNLFGYDNSWSSIKLSIGAKNALCPFMYDVMHETNDIYTLEKGDLCLVGRSIISLQTILNQSSDVYPADADHVRSGNTLNYNLYRFDHLKPFRDLDALEATLADMPSDELYQMILEQYGPDSVIAKHYSYEEKAYVQGETYQANVFIVHDSLVTQAYEERKAYASGVMIVDLDTRNMYRSERAFFSTTLEQDIANHNITFVGVKPTEQTASLYATSRAFVASDIQTDTSNGNMRYIGPSVKFNTMVNYVLSRTFNPTIYDQDDLCLFAYAGDSVTPPENNPIGAFVPLMDTVHQNVKVGTTAKTVDPLYIFRVEETIADLDNFRMYDGDIDISADTMLIMKIDGEYRKYTFHNNKWEYAYK